MDYSGLPPQVFEIIKYFIIALILFFIDKLSQRIFDQAATPLNLKGKALRISKSVLRIIVWAFGGLFVLDNLGISITPILASLGVGSLAVALALQPTLENFFAGLQIMMDRSIKEGQFIKLESGEEGYVRKIGWRSTWIQMLANNTVILPNKILVDSRIINYYYPETEMAVLVQMGVHYGSDLEHVERVTIEVAKEALEQVPGGIANFDPFIRYHTFDSSSINFTVILRVKEFVDNYLMKHEFIKRVQKRYAQEGICIPFPIRAINLDQENSYKLIKEIRKGE